MSPAQSGEPDRVAIRRGAFEDAGRGVAVWLTYAVAEATFAAASPSLLPSSTSHAGLHLYGLLACFAVYAAVGAITGAAAGIAARSRARGDLAVTPSKTDALLAASVYLTCAANLAWGESSSASAWTGAGLCAALAISSVSGQLRVRPLASPWAAVPVALGLTWLLAGRFAEHYGWIPLGIAILALSALPFAVSLAARGLAARIPTLGSRSNALTAAALVAATTMLLLSAHRPARPGTELSGELQDGSMPNVVLISLDTVGAEHLSAYGYARSTSPALEEFARGATLYSHALATSAWTLPSHASMFTGLYPRAHGAHFAPPTHPDGRALSMEFTTLAERMAGWGYATAGVVANFGALGRAFQLDQGFQFYDDERRVLFLHTPFLRDRILRALNPRFRHLAFDKETLAAEEINEVALRVLDQLAGSGQRFLFFVNYMDAHTPYLPPPPFDDRFEGRDPDFGEAEYWQALEEVMKLQRPLSRTERRHLVSQYDGAIAYMDLHLGLLLDRLEALDLYDDALIIITSDHGESFGRHMLIGHGTSVVQAQIHVPLLIKYPGQEQGRVVDQAVSLIDLLPTIAGVIGQSTPSQLPGVDLRQPAAAEGRALVSESYRNPGRTHWHRRFDRNQRALLDGSLKLIQASPGGAQLYDLGADPAERENLARVRREELARLQAELGAWLDATTEPERSEEPITPETREKLEALGYLE